MTATVEPKLSSQQFTAFYSEAREVFFIGGVGAGKSYLLGLASFRALSNVGAVIGIFAPTIKTLKNSTLKQVKICWEELGFYEDVDYVINCAPPARWGVQKFSGVSNNKILTTRWGSYAILDGLDNFHSQRGVEFDEIFLDEFRDIDTEARDVLVSRLRGRLYRTSGTKHRAWYATTPPTNISYLRELYESANPEVQFVFAPSYSNVINITHEYIESMRNTYDDITFRREVLGELVVNTNHKFLWSFNHNKHIGSTEMFDLMPLYLSFDFNVSPMTAILAQHYTIHGKEFIYILREYHAMNMDVYKFGEMINSTLPKKRRLYITGDSSGNSRHILGKEGVTAYAILKSVLNVWDGDICVPKTNMTHIDSRILCNSILQRHPNIVIDRGCKKLLKDIDNCVVDEDGKLDKSDKNSTHLLDCFRYYIHNFHSKFLSNNNRNETKVN